MLGLGDDREIWLAKRAIKKLGEFIEVLSSVEDAGKTGKELPVAVAA